jgi:hypothetical protein
MRQTGRQIIRGSGGGYRGVGGLGAFVTISTGLEVAAGGLQATISYRGRFRGLLAGDSGEKHWAIDDDCDY